MMNNELAYHVPALLNQSIEALNIGKGGKFVDATFGGGGHSKAILKVLNNKGHLYAFDRDADAQENIPADKNFTLIHHNFSHLKNYLRYFEAIPIDGILADLGISSHQIDEGERGFSFRFDAQLDMRMDRHQKLSAKEIVNEYSAKDLQQIFSKYGEVKNAKTLAEAIVTNRIKQNIETTSDLATVAERIIPARENLKKYLAPVFQALRIEVNQELETLKDFLYQCHDVLKPGGRLAVITYHSLEDRLVKDFIQSGNFDGKSTKDVFGNVKSIWKQVTRKPIIPSEEEINKNPRVRSAKLRIAEKT